jgi:hypothetical protein
MAKKAKNNSGVVVEDSKGLAEAALEAEREAKRAVIAEEEAEQVAEEAVNESKAADATVQAEGEDDEEPGIELPFPRATIVNMLRENLDK